MSGCEDIRAFEHAGWEQAAESYDASFAMATSQFVGPLLDAAGVTAGTRVLDIACGTGVVTAAAFARGAEARGLDFSSAMLRVARARQPALAFNEGDAEALPYPDRSFDAVVSNFGIHHVPRPLVALREAWRVLRRGGPVAFTVWAVPEENIAWKLVLDAVRRRGDMAASQAPAPGGGLRTPDDCRACLEQAGFGAIGTRHLSGVWRHADGGALLAALRSGTARMAAVIRAQSEAAIPAIIADIEHHAAAYRDGAELAVPLAALVAWGQRE